MEPQVIAQSDDGCPTEGRDDDDPRSRAIVPVGRKRQWRDPGPKFIAALCYFAWLGWITAPAPLLFLNSRRMRSARGIPYHLYAAAAWSTVVTLVRGAISLLSTGLYVCGWSQAEAVCSALNLIYWVVVLTFALLLSGWYALEALLGRETSIPWISDWARRRADHFLGRD
ncbi:MAG: hypothetical protein ACOCX2_08590 [Armatimonadota bacterium]